MKNCMKKTIFTLAIVVTSITVIYAQTVKPEISNVIVYYDSALVKKEANVNLHKGENVITIEGLPASMVNESVQVVTKGAMVRDVSVQTTYLKKGDVQRINALKEKLESINNEINAKQNDIQALNTVLEYIKKGSTSPFTVAMTAAQMQSILQLIEQHSSQSYKKIATLQQALQKLKEEKERLEKELSLLNTGEATKSLQLVVVHTGQDSAIVMIQYITGDAGWKMEYEARANTEAQTVEVVCNARVYQRTGEDWKDVSLELSTSKPFVATQKPVLNPWYLDVYQPSHYYKESPKSMALRSQDAAEAPQEAEEMPVMQEERIAFSFQIKGTKTIPSDGNAYKIPVAKATTDCTVRYATVPKVLPYVMLEGEFPNPFDFPMQGGNLNVYLDGKFVNSFNVNKLYVPKDLITVALGVDESLMVERKLLSKKTEYKGLVSKTKRIEYVYSIKLANGKKRDVTVTVQDAIPVSQNEKITVTLVNKNSIGAVIDNEGKATWQVQLSPNQKKELTIHFAVEYPESIQVTGLE
ncbi:MAG: mucoidy inhibitor MuiA family protein [Spirochaetota bacterium]|nr:mucoidy inhibitor MuiA family protein [Spirochaetota bacterium]